MRAPAAIALLASLLAPAVSARAAACAEGWREPLRGAVLRVAHYPYESALRVYLDLSAVAEAKGLARASIELVDAAGARAGGPFELPIAAAVSPGGVQRVLELPALAPGAWRARAQFASHACAAIPGAEVGFVVRRFGWEHNGLGEPSAVFPPFTAIEVNERTLGTVLRSHTLGDSGLWDRATSDGAPLLAAPMRLEIEAEGKAQTIAVDAPASVVARSPARVETHGELRAGPLALRVDGALEFDGLYRLRIAVDGAPRTRIERFDLVIPLRRERATLMNAITDETRHHWLGSVPAGSGVVWSAVNAPRSQLDAGFVPYVWVGDEQRGLSFLAESTRDFWFEPGRSMAELRRSGDSVELVIHFASAAGPLARARTLEFALQATPVKPRPLRWRDWQLACDARTPFVALCPLPAGFYWGTETRFGSVAPRGRDERILRWLGRARRGGRVDPRLWESWLDRSGVAPADRAEALASLRFSFDAFASKPAAAIVYFNAQGAAWGPEFAAYNDEWRLAPFADGSGADEPAARELRVLPRASYRDYVLWHVERLLASGAADGVYFDNTFLRASFDDRVGSAYRDERGALHPGVEVYALRELLRRTQALVYARRGEWWTIAHATTTPISAIHGFAGVILDGEEKYGEAPFMARFSAERMRASALGAQAGAVPAWLPGIVGVPEPRRSELHRQLLGFAAVYEQRLMDRFTGPQDAWWRTLRAAGYGQPECATTHSWEAPPRLELAGAAAEWLAIDCGERVSAVVVARASGGSLMVRARGQRARACRDLDGLGRVRAEGGACQLALRPEDVRLIELRGIGSR